MEQVKDVLERIKKDYAERWKLHASRQGKDPVPPRSVLSDLIDAELRKL